MTSPLDPAAFAPPDDARYRPRRTRPAVPVTERQAELLFWLSVGLTRHQIGTRVGVAESTVRTVLRALYLKLDVHTATEAVRVGFETGLLLPRERPPAP